MIRIIKKLGTYLGTARTEAVICRRIITIYTNLFGAREKGCWRGDKYS